MWDAVVGGAGPAGATAALVLARMGARVVLADSIDAGAHKVGEALPGAAVRFLRAQNMPSPEEMGVHSRILGNLSCWGSEALLATDFFRDPDGVGWRLDRSRFDGALREAALGAGANWMGSRVRQIERVGSCWRVRFHDGTETEARWLIDAGGRKSPLAAQFGVARRQDVPLIAFYALGRTNDERPVGRTVVEAVQKGWWYAAQLPCGKLTAGFHVRPEDARALAGNPDLWSQSWAETRHLREAFPGAEFTEHLPPVDASGGQLDRFHGDGWIVCGDAALSFDPLSSQGMLTALYSGMNAARSIFCALQEREHPMAAYQVQLESIRRSYLARIRKVYRQEQRWADERFWRCP